ncbi:MAG: polyphenol oxidase family protein [Candidatus Comchoanobacterales bacterium]
MFPEWIEWGWQLTPIPHAASIWQQHSNIAIQANAHVSMMADAQWTTSPRQTIMVKTADCLPIVVAHKQIPWAAVIHAGWRGLVNDIIPQTLAHAPSHNLCIWIGPCIHAQSFIFNDKENLHYFPSDCRYRHQGNTHVDLRLLAKQQLIRAGVSKSDIYRSLLNTFTMPGLPSYRRNKTRNRLYTWVRINQQVPAITSMV